ncbi:MAG: transcription-repair coupling factor, partial [Oscillospiraceae bacterium]|nr:transcription-repair coupling factor [Oscillospiraceae bacterium]
MKELTDQILHHKELAALPDLPESGGLPALISGLSAVHRANLAAALSLRLSRPLFVLTPDDTSAENFARDLQSMLGLPVQTLGLREFCFLPAEAVSRRTEQQRLTALHALAVSSAGVTPPPVTVASVSAMLQRTIPAEILRKAAFSLRVGECVPLEDVLDALVRCGYERTEQVEGPGQFACRGGILDLFTPAEDLPVRMEFWGDDIDSMGFFDISTQRREENIDACTVLPAAEALPTLCPGG